MEKRFNFREYVDNTSVNFVVPENALFTLVDKAIVKYGKHIPKPDTIISINQKGYNEVEAFTKGSISLITGKAKSGKTAFTSIIAKAILTGQVNGEYTSLSSHTTKKVLVFDTEQGEYYASKSLYYILCQCEDKQDRLIYYDLRPHEPKKRLDMIKIAIEQNKDDMDFILIDGVRDITYDINSSEEAIKVVSELMELSVTYNIHICTILHQNKGDSNARGHLGSECTNKSEIVISVEKDDSNDCSIIDAVYTRGIGFKPFAIKRNQNGIPYIDGVAISKSEGKRKRSHDFDDISEDIHLGILNECFSKKEDYKYTELYRTIKFLFAKSGFTIGDNKAKDFVLQYQNNEWITKLSQQYFFNNDYNSPTPF